MSFDTLHKRLLRKLAKKGQCYKREYSDKLFIKAKSVACIKKRILKQELKLLSFLS